MLNDPPGRRHHGGPEAARQFRGGRVDQPHGQPGFLGDLAQRGLGLGLVGFHVTPGWHHPAEAGMLDEPDPPPVRPAGEDENARGRMLHGHRLIVPHAAPAQLTSGDT